MHTPKQLTSKVRPGQARLSAPGLVTTGVLPRVETLSPRRRPETKTSSVPGLPPQAQSSFSTLAAAGGGATERFCLFKNIYFG